MKEIHNSKEFSQIIPKFILALGLLIAVLIGLYALYTQLFFYFDQARDAFEAFDIWHNHNIKILGPTTDIPGAFHGVGWYYFLALLYFLFRDPQLVGLAIFLLTFITVPVVWILARELFIEKVYAYIAVLLYVFSPLFLLYSRWISNPWLGFVTVPFLLLFLLRYITQKKGKYMLLLGISFGVLIQSDLAFVIFLMLLPIYWLVFKLPLKLTHLGLFILGLLGALSTYIIAEIKFNWRATTSLLSYVMKDHDSSSSVIDILARMGSKYLHAFSVSVFAVQDVIVVIVLTICLVLGIKVYEKKSRKSLLFLLIWLLNIALFQLFSTGITNSVFVFGPSLVSLVLLVSYLVGRLRKNMFLISVVVILLIAFQVNTSLLWMRQQLFPLTIQKGMTLQQARKAVDYMYNSSQLKPFSITSITNPFYINTTWDYHFSFYGKNTYGYVPFWHGRDQSGYLGLLPYKLFATDNRYMIIEPVEGIPTVYIDKLLYEENKISDIIEVRKFGLIKVQKRMFHSNKTNVATPSSLLNSPVLHE